MNIEEQIKEIDAIINLYKDEPNDGLRNKIWAWHTNLLKQQEQEIREGSVKEIIEAYEKWQWEENPSGERYLPNEYIDKFVENYLKQEEDK